MPWRFYPFGGFADVNRTAGGASANDLVLVLPQTLTPRTVAARRLLLLPPPPTWTYGAVSTCSGPPAYVTTRWRVPANSSSVTSLHPPSRGWGLGHLPGAQRVQRTPSPGTVQIRFPVLYCAVSWRIPHAIQGLQRLYRLHPPLPSLLPAWRMPVLQRRNMFVSPALQCRNISLSLTVPRLSYLRSISHALTHYLSFISLLSPTTMMYSFTVDA